MADLFTDLEVTGVSIFRDDLIFDRTAFDNSIVQGTNAFAAGKHLIYQVQGGGDMSRYVVRANSASFTGGPVGIGTETPDLSVALDVNGVAKFNNDLIFDRTAFDNSIVQGQNAFAASKHLIYQKVGGGPMSGYIVRALNIGLTGGNVGIGTEFPTEPLDVVGNIRLTGNIVSPNDIRIGTCP